MAEELDIDRLIGSMKREFEPRPYYSPESDALYFYCENEDYAAERIDCWLTVFRAFSDNRIIGFKIKNVKILLSKFDALGLDCRLSTSKWFIWLQPLIAYIPNSVALESDFLQYRNVLTSFGSRLAEPLSLEPA